MLTSTVSPGENATNAFILSLIKCVQLFSLSYVYVCLYDLLPHIVWAMMALTLLCGCKVLSEPWLQAYTVCSIISSEGPFTSQAHHKKTNNVAVRHEKTPNSLFISYVWSESWLSAWWHIHWKLSKDSDQMPRPICAFVRCTHIFWFCHVMAHLYL